MRVAVGRGSGERVRKCKRQRETEKRREQSRRCKAPFLVYYLKQIPKQMNSLNENSLLFLFFYYFLIFLAVEWPKGGVVGCAISWGDDSAGRFYLAYEIIWGRFWQLSLLGLVLIRPFLGSSVCSRCTAT